MSPMGLMYWEIHTATVPCPACRSMVGIAVLDSQRLYCDPEHGGCGHYHRGPCPEIAPNESEAQNA